MTLVVNNNTDPYFNMAFDEWCLEHYRSDTLFYIWRNKPSVIVGCNQAIALEVDEEYCHSKGIDIVRRCTGGGTVYHDLGNVNFSFIGSADNLNFVEESKHLIIKSLNVIGIKAITASGNDLFVDFKKISGTAIKILDKAVLFHGTLLFDVDINQIYNISNKETGKIIKKTIQSRPSLVTNIRPLLETEMTTESFMLRLQELVLQDSFSILTLSPSEISNIESIADHKYRSREWIYCV